MTATPALWQGIIPPMVTPLAGRDQLDHEGLAGLVEHLIAGGVHGLFVLGTTGEGPSLSYRLRRELIATVCERVAGRIPVLVGITDTSIVEQLQLAQWAANHGTAGLVLAPPYYFPAGQAELKEYLHSLAPELPLPLFLYNMPAMTKLSFDVDTVAELAEHKQIVGLKDSSASMVYFHKLRQAMDARRPGFKLLVGPEELLAEAVLLGADGGVCGGANLFPKLYVDLYRAAAERNLDRVVSLHKTVMKVNSTIYNVGQHASSIIKGIKCGLHAMGVCQDYMEYPFHRFREPERAMIQRYVKSVEADLG